MDPPIGFSSGSHPSPDPASSKKNPVREIHCPPIDLETGTFHKKHLPLTLFYFLGEKHPDSGNSNALLPPQATISSGGRSTSFQVKGSPHRSRHHIRTLHPYRQRFLGGLSASKSRHPPTSRGTTLEPSTAAGDDHEGPDDPADRRGGRRGRQGPRAGLRFDGGMAMAMASRFPLGGARWCCSSFK